MRHALAPDREGVMAYESNTTPKWLGCLGVLAVLAALALVVYLFIG
jgi:hypothetical protein